MSPKTDIGIFYGDQRQVYMALSLLEEGYHIYTCRLSAAIEHENCIALHSLDELFGQCKLLIGPVPLIRGSAASASASAPELSISNLSALLTKDHFLIAGMIPPDLEEICKAKEIPYYDLMKNERIAILNAIATAEGTIMEAIQNSERNLHGSRCLVTGYGRCARVLAGKLKGMDAKVTIAARSEEALAYAEAAGLIAIPISNMMHLLPTYDFIFNTVPSLLFDKSRLALVRPDVTMLDIASAPGGIDYNYAAQKKLKARLYPGLPGKVSPKASADILVNEILALMKERSD